MESHRRNRWTCVRPCDDRDLAPMPVRRIGTIPGRGSGSGTISRPKSGPRRCRSATAGSARWSSAARRPSESSSMRTPSGRAIPSSGTRSGRTGFLPAVRRMLFEGKYSEAQKLVQTEFMAANVMGSYQTLGDLAACNSATATPSLSTSAA